MLLSHTNVLKKKLKIEGEDLPHFSLKRKEVKRDFPIWAISGTLLLFQENHVKPIGYKICVTDVQKFHEKKWDFYTTVNCQQVTRYCRFS